MSSHRPFRPRALVLFALCALVAALPAPAQEVDPTLSDAERERAAREEQAERRRAEADAKREAGATAEEQAEQERLAELGADGAELQLEEKEGFFLRVDAFATSIDGTDTPIATVGDIVTSATTAEELDTDGNGLPDAFTLANRRDLRLEYDSVLTPQVELGWRLGRRASLSARWWSLSQSASVSAAASLELASGTGGAGLVLGGIDGTGSENDGSAAWQRDPGAFARAFGGPRLVVENQLHGAESVVADGDVEASRLDLFYTRTGLARKNLVLTYRVGLTMADFDRRESATFTWRSFEQSQVGLNALSVETVAASSESSAMGATVGIAGRYLLGSARRWSVRFGVDVSGLQADPKLTYQDSHVIDLDILEPQEEVFHDVRTEDGEDFITVLDGDLAVEALLGDKFRLAVGYRHATWLDSLTSQKFPDADNPAVFVRDVMDVDLSGPYVRLGIFF